MPGRPSLRLHAFRPSGALGCVSPGIGFDLRVGGGWSEAVIAHESLVHIVGNLPAHRAVLTEPAAMRAGASRILPAGCAAIEALAESDGGRLVRPRPPFSGQVILEPGVDAVFDYVGVRSTVDLSMRMLRPTGMLVLVGGAGLQVVDWSLVWARELTIQGTINSGPEPALDGRTSFGQVVEWLADPAYRIDGIVTHELPLEGWQEALETAAAGPATGAIKVTFRP